jgi:hypothetical protein
VVVEAGPMALLLKDHTPRLDNPSTPIQRHLPDHPCPICSGHASLLEVEAYAALDLLWGPQPTALGSSTLAMCPLTFLPAPFLPPFFVRLLRLRRSAWLESCSMALISQDGYSNSSKRRTCSGAGPCSDYTTP